MCQICVKTHTGIKHSYMVYIHSVTIEAYDEKYNYNILYNIFDVAIQFQ